MNASTFETRPRKNRAAAKSARYRTFRHAASYVRKTFSVQSPMRNVVALPESSRSTSATTKNSPLMSPLYPASNAFIKGPPFNFFNCFIIKSFTFLGKTFQQLMKDAAGLFDRVPQKGAAEPLAMPNHASAVQAPLFPPSVSAAPVSAPLPVSRWKALPPQKRTSCEVL